MGIAIEVAGFPVTVPHRLKVTFDCDATTGFFCRGFKVVEGVSYQEAHHEAIAEGWLERNASNGRVWLCPDCSGK